MTIRARTSTPGFTLFQDDLDGILEQLADLFRAEFRGGRLFLTGGSSFFGLWLLESLLYANQRLALGARVTVLARDPARFHQKAPHLSGRPDLSIIAGDVRSFACPSDAFTHLIHAATESDPAVHARNPLQVLATEVDGTRRMLEFAGRNAGCKFLFTSSGSVYGRQPPDLAHLPETYAGGPAPADPRALYAEGKRVGELLCTLSLAQYGLAVKIARGFAFTGAYLPLDRNFAVGNFVRDALAGGPIRITGDGTPVRSYLYGSDLAVWLWTILARGKPGQAYNVGSDQAVTIAQLAQTVAGIVPDVEVEIAGKPEPGVAPERYVPCVARARQELGLAVTVPLAEGVRRMVDWYTEHAMEK